MSGEISAAVADTGYFSENNIVECEKMEIEPIISTAREKHNSFLNNYLTQQPEPTQSITQVEKMEQKLKSGEGKEIYKKRKQTVEPVLGSSKKYWVSGDFH